MNVLPKPKVQLQPATPSILDLPQTLPDLDQPSKQGQSVSEEEYWRTYYHHADYTYEWNDGLLEEIPMADLAKSKQYLWFIALLRLFLRIYPIADITVLEIGFRVALPHKTTVRKPDAGVILKTNKTPMADGDRTYQGVYDLCIESLSDSKQKEIDRDTIEKKQEYEQVGVQEYFILDDRGRETVFYERTARGIYKPLAKKAGGVIESKVLKGFQFREEDLYRQPDLMELVGDEVYKHYVLPEYLAQVERAEEAERRAEEAERRAKQEQRQREAAQQQNERLLAQLKSLGVEPAD